MDESHLREREYHMNGEGCYMLNISENEAVDATRCYDRIGRLINHASRNENCRLHRPLIVDGKKRVVLIASRDINIGEELFFDYGIR